MKFVVTAGPTREAIDPVRYLSNRSSGKMGYAIAEAAVVSGHAVTLISGPVCLAPPANARMIHVTSADELFDAVHAEVNNCDVLVMCAAVADYKPALPVSVKLKKQTNDFALALKPTRDILASVSKRPRNYFVVGFAAETEKLEAHARAKLLQKGCDLIVANDVSKSDSGMESAENAVTIFVREGKAKTLARAGKIIIAREILKIILATREKALTKKA